MGEVQEAVSLRVNFVRQRRQQFRRYFQPSRILLCVMPAPNTSGLNIIPLCFCMHCSYKPPMLAIAIQDSNASYEFIERAREYVLAVPGTSMLNETVYCGTTSARNVDKVRELNLHLLPSEKISVPGVRNAIANIEMLKESSVEVGDHILVVGRAVNFRVNVNSKDLPLLSVGPDTRGYKVLARQGIHRIGTIAARVGALAES